MKRRVYFGLILCFALLVCTLVLTACDFGEQPAIPGDTATLEQTETEVPPEQPEHVHEFGEWVVIKEPTCTEYGVKEQYCACGEKQTDAVEKLAHVEVIAPAVEATCTQSGWTEGTHCEVCLNSVVPQTEIPPLGHLEDSNESSEPTCTEQGWIAEIFCKRCFVVLVPIEFIPATGHDYTYKQEIVPPYCDKPGYTVHYCHCGAQHYDSEVEALGHALGDWYTYREATCTDMGLMHKECMRCDYIEKQEIPPLGHAYSAVVIPPSCTEQGYTRHTCRCGDTFFDEYTDALGHSYSVTVIQPWCGSSGYTEYTCYCGHTYADSYVDPLGHNYEIVVIQPTCTSAGYTTGTCTRCLDSHTYDYTDPVPHQLGEAFYATFPTCTEPGMERQCCSSCSFYQDRYVAPLGHRYQATVIEPTCTEGGYTAYSCICGLYYNDLITPALGHSYEMSVIPATCTEEGYTQYACRCGTIHYEDYQPALNHQYQTVVTQPTCISQGYSTHTCIRCQDAYVDTYTNTVGHTLDNKIVSATCTEGGYIQHTCTYCGYSYTSSHSDPKGHNFWRWEVDVQATCTQNGRESRYCMSCKLVEERVIEAPGHQFTESVKQATCTADGYTTHSCSSCGYTYTDSYVTATGHSYTDWVVEKPATCIDVGRETRHCTKCGMGGLNTLPALGHDYKAVVTMPTCTSRGYTTYTCVNCSRSYNDDYTEAIPHAWTDWYLYTSPTCLQDGYNRRHCEVCQYAQSSAIEKLGHDYAQTTVTPPTCREQGYTTHACTRCGHSYKDTYVAVIKHNYETTIIEPTCTEWGGRVEKCTMCDSSMTHHDVKPLGHDYFLKQVVPTCLGKGYKEYTCNRCGETHIEDEIAALGHDYQTVVTAPTCTSYGYTTYTCSRCGDSYETDTTMPTDHISEPIPPVEPTFQTHGWIGGRRCSVCGMQLEAQTQVGMYRHIYVEYNEAAAVVDAPDKASLGTYITITATPKSGYEFVGWYIGDVLMCETPAYTFEVGIDEYTYTAKFKSSNTWDGKVGDGFAGGSGTKDDPYLISNGWELAYLAYQINYGNAAQYNNKYYALTADIDLGNVNWDPIGSIYNASGVGETSKSFIGHFDGRGFTVYNLFINASKYNFNRFFGLFGVVEAGGYVENVNVSGCNIVIDGDVKGQVCCGGIAGRIVTATVANCKVDGKISASTSSSGARVGGIVGITFARSVIADCYAEVTVNGSSSDNNAFAGGIAGNIEDTTIARCWANATVSASGSGSVYVATGGIAGYAHTSSVIYDCYSSGSVSGSNRRVECRVGGVVGAAAGVTIARCYTTCTVFAKSEYYALAGGVVGHTLETDYGNSITQCLALASVSADNYGGWYTYVGKICGRNADGSLSNNHTSKTDSVDFYTSTLGWSADVWDFGAVESGGLPTLKH